MRLGEGKRQAVLRLVVGLAQPTQFLIRVGVGVDVGRGNLTAMTIDYHPLAEFVLRHSITGSAKVENLEIC